MIFQNHTSRICRQLREITNERERRIKRRSNQVYSKSGQMSEPINLTPNERKAVLELIKSSKLTSVKPTEKLKINSRVVECTADLPIERSCLKNIFESREKNFEISLARKKQLKLLPFDISRPFEMLTQGRFYG